MSDLVTVSKSVISKIEQVSSAAIDRIITSYDPKSSETVFHLATVNDVLLQELSDWMPVVDAKTRVFGRSATQWTSRTMSLNMISAEPFSCLKQCLAQIESRRSAIRDTTFGLKKNAVSLERMRRRLERLQGSDAVDVDLDIADLEIEIQQTLYSIAESSVYYEGALKELIVFMDAYKEIIKNAGIRDDWDEVDATRAELTNHLRTALTHALRDFQAHPGTTGSGTLEYLEQHGVNPVTVRMYVSQYLQRMEVLTQGEPELDMSHKQYDPDTKRYYNPMKLDEHGSVVWRVPPREPTIQDQYHFIDYLVDHFKDTWAAAWTRTGLSIDKQVNVHGLLVTP